MSKILTTRNLSTEEFGILTRVVKDPFFFSTFVYLIHQKRGKTKFDLYPFQKAVLREFLNNRYNIILKFRQAGITELISLYCLWLAMYHPNKNIIIISIKERVAKKVLRKIKYMYKNLPDYLKIPVINGRGQDLGTSTEMEFSSGSIITSVPTTEDAGRSEAAALMVIDEAAIVRWADKIWAAAFPTLSTGGASIVNSTPFGVGNFFHKQWVGALSGENGFNPIRLRWTMHPERDEAWYWEMRKALGDRKTAQEIDGDFLSSGNSVFNLADIRDIEEELSEYPPIRTKYNGKMLIFDEPDDTDNYFIGADVASGRSRDFSTFSIYNSSREEVACFKGKYNVAEFSEILGDEGMAYNRATLAPECNEIGEGVTANLEMHGYPNLYYTVSMLKKKGEPAQESKIPGWYTTGKNRTKIIEKLSSDLSQGKVLLKNPYFCQESYTFIYDEQNRPICINKNKTQGNQGDEDVDDSDGYTDDAILAEAITNYISDIHHKNYSVPSI